MNSNSARLKYCEIPRGDSPDTLTTPINNRLCSQEYESEDLIHHGENFFEMPLLTLSNSPPQIQMKHQRKVSECPFRQNGGGTLKAKQRKSHSLPSSNSLNDICDHDEMEITEIPAEEFAAHITVRDMRIFRNISPDELTSCAWNKRTKAQLTPNIVALTKQFNQVSFWVVQEILKGLTAKERSDIIVHFLKIAKKLYELNNLHSLFAVVAAMRSASIYRLTRSWSYVPKQWKMTLDKLSDVFSEEDNWKNMREKTDSLKLPCVPYLGLFLTDLTYVDMAHPHTGGLETEQRCLKMNNTLRIISHFQQSDYGALRASSQVQRHLNAVQYIEELQKFIEDDQYRLSLKLEPVNEKVDNSKKLSTSNQEAVPQSHLSPAKVPSRSNSCRKSHTFVPTHRKCHTVGARFFSRMANIEDPQRHHPLDDSVIEEDNHRLATIGSINKRAMHWLNDFSSKEDYIVMEGCLKKKSVSEQGCHPNVSTWRRFWIQLSTSALLFYSARGFKGTCRNDFKKEPCKVWSVVGCIVSLCEQPEIFLLKYIDKSKMYKFRAENDAVALKWFKTLYDVSEGRPLPVNSANLITFE